MKTTVERIELNTDEGKYIKCNGCGRLSPEQRYCKYCFSQLTAGDKPEVKSIYITREKPYSPVADFSAMRERIDSDFKAGDVNFSELGITEDEYNLKFTPPTQSSKEEDYPSNVSARFEDAYKRYEKKATAAYTEHKETLLFKKERESIKQIISDTPTQTVFTASGVTEKAKTVSDNRVENTQENSIKNHATVADNHRNDDLQLVASGGIKAQTQNQTQAHENLTIRRADTRFRFTFLSAVCFVASLLTISTLFLPFVGGAIGLDVVSLIPSVLGANINENIWLTLADHPAFTITSAAVLLVSAITLYQFFAFSVAVLTDKKQKNYADFVLSFTSLLASVVVLFASLIAGFSLTDFNAGIIILLVASTVNFIASTGKMLRQ